MKVNKIKIFDDLEGQARICVNLVSCVQRR